MLDNVVQNFEQVKSVKPFQVLFFGSRSREEHDPTSDVNLYLIAAVEDQIQGSFLEKILLSVKPFEDLGQVEIGTGDPSGMLSRLRMWEPTAAHVIELGYPIFGKPELKVYYDEWEKAKQGTWNRTPLIEYLKMRREFYKKIEFDTKREESSRLERYVSYCIQIWVLEKVADLSLSEMIHLDIPNRIIDSLPVLYEEEWDDEIENLYQMFTELHPIRKFINAEESEPKKKKGSKFFRRKSINATK